MEHVAENDGLIIERTETGMLFRSRRTGGPMLVTSITGGLAALCTMFAIVLVTMVIQNRDPIYAAVATGAWLLAGLFGWAAWRAYRIYVQRKNGDGDVLRLAHGVLTGTDGAICARPGELRLAVKIDWTDGMGGLRFMRVLWLIWPKGRTIIYKNYDQDAVAAVQRAVAAALTR